LKTRGWLPGPRADGWNIREAVAVLLPGEPHLDHDGFDGLLETIAADRGNELRAPFGNMLQDAIRGALTVEKPTEPV
jgi:hypothetical protein